MRRITAVMFAGLVILSLSLPALADDYKLASDDVIELNIWQEPELSKKQMQLNPEGYINIPYIESPIQAKGLTIRELSKKIHDMYVDAEYLKDPKVDINIISRHKLQAWVLGQVNRPGALEFKQGDTITSAVSQAGSTNDAAWLESATLTHKSSDKPIPLDLHKLLLGGDLSQNYELQEGDIIYVPEDTHNKYYVLGEVRQPGMYRLKDNASVLSAVMTAGGQTPRGSLKGTVLVRGDLKNPEKRMVDLGKIRNGDLSQDVKLEAGDVVYVPETNKPDLQQIGSILSTLLNLSYLRRVGF
jgi:polysaccharide export outer membrane protein